MHVRMYACIHPLRGQRHCSSLEFLLKPQKLTAHTEVKIDQPQLSSYVLEAVTHAHTHTHTHTHTHFFAQGREPRAAPPLCGGIVS
jgi:hypothetical protein